MNALQLLSAKTDLILTHQQGQIRMYGHSTGEGLVIKADSPRVLKAALRTWLRPVIKSRDWRKIRKQIRNSPQVLRIQVGDRSLIVVGKGSQRIHYLRLLPYLPVFL